MGTEKKNVIFRRINGRIIPIRAGKIAGIAAVGLATSDVISSSKKRSPINPNRGLQALGFSAALADGLISGLTLAGGGAKRFIAGQGASIGLSAASSAANVASFAGKGHGRDRIKGAVKQEAINTLAGYAAFGATALAVPQSRKALIQTAAKALSFFKGKIGALL